MAKTKILVVEDEAITSLFIEQCLESLGYDVVDTAISGEEALEMVSIHKPDLILMDIMLAGEKTGIETADEVYRDYDIPVIFLTAYSDTQTLKKAVNTGSFGYILKPVEEKSLRPAIEIALNKYKEENSLKASHAWLNTMIENINDVIIATDLSMNIRFVNKEAENLLGQIAHTLSAKNIFSVLNISAREEKEILNHINKNLKVGKTDKFGVIVKLKEKDYRINITFLVNQEKETIGIIYNLSLKETTAETVTKPPSDEQQSLKKLTDLLGICSFCKKIKDDENQWNKLEEYLQDMFNIKFSHGVCPDCARNYYSEVYKK